MGNDPVLRIFTVMVMVTVHRCGRSQNNDVFMNKWGKRPFFGGKKIFTYRSIYKFSILLTKEKHKFIRVETVLSNPTL